MGRLPGVADEGSVLAVVDTLAWVRRPLACLVLATVVLVGSPMGRAETTARPTVCVLTVKNSGIESLGSSPEVGPIGHSARFMLAGESVMQPGIPEPILYRGLYGSPGRNNTITPGNTLQRLTGVFPFAGLTDHFAVDGATGRLLAVNHYDGLFSFDLRTSRFSPILLTSSGGRVTSAGIGTFSSIAYVPRLGHTLLGTDNGVYRLAGDVLEPVGGAEGQKTGLVTTMVDLPVHEAILVNGGHDRIVLLHDDGTTEPLLDLSGGVVSSDDYLVAAYESQKPGRIIIRTGRSLIEVEMHPSRAGFSPGRLRTLMSHGATPGVMTQAGEYLLLGRPGWFTRYGLEKLEADGLHPVPGDPPRNLDGARLWKATSLGGVLIETKDGLFRYDGTRVTEVASSSPERIGRYVSPVDVPAVGLITLQTDQGLFTLDREGRLKRLVVPGYSYTGNSVSELAAAHVGLVATEHDLFAFDSDGNVWPIPGDTHDRYQDPFVGAIPSRDVMLLGGDRALYLVAAGTACKARSGD